MAFAPNFPPFLLLFLARKFPASRASYGGAGAFRSSLDTENFRACSERRRKGGNMQQILKDFGLDMLRQLFGWGRPREVRLMLTRHAVNRMHEYQLDEATLKDVFRHGERTGEKITRQYTHYSVGLYYKYDEARMKFVITTCWKGGV
jgi:hypothetical protein